ncbi:hypothetical protein GOHSU_22_00360 [Gordonia hirsuta DSM 44140 = NBRC 16056]|uniref:TIGR02611 family protein n=1 Tax=Gordonia hirsuta DSM 44140 = NBRC 16056 TaxID=1121927 RepID=L7LA11_9ACTN|nr:hypothetical protein GOHSU_22_00360 [Gordonia hirsuta DSM 44140 = NBRC 16056]
MANQLYRLAVGIAGTVLMLAGLVMIPLPIPGPGWVTLFLGLAVLSTEFTWAHRATSFLRARLHQAGEIGNRISARTRAAVRAYADDHILAHAHIAFARFTPVAVAVHA